MKITLFKLFPYLLLAGVAFLSYHQLLQMYFWRDDYTGLYFAQVENLSKEFAFAYPYQIPLLLDKFAWQLFGLNATYYFLLATILYITSAWLLFCFLRKVFDSKMIAFFCGLVFVAGYIGQDAMKMTLGDGLGAVLALNILLLGLVLFLRYLQSGKKALFIFSLIAFTLTLEVSPHRTSSSLFIFLLLDWIFTRRDQKVKIIFRNMSFILIFLVQYFIHPSVWLLGYRIITPTNFLGLLTTFSPLYFLNPLGTFWNMIFPSHIHYELNILMGIYKEPPDLSRFLLTGLPAYLFAVIHLVFLRLIRPSVFGFMELGKFFGVFTVFSILLAHFVFGLKIDPTDQVSIFNGGIFLSLIILWVVVGMANSRALSVFSLLALFGMLSIFFLTIPERVLVSYNRYLLLPSFAAAFLPVIFITKEFYSKTGTRKIFARGLFFGIIFILVVPRLLTALSTQQEFVQSYSLHAKRFYQQLREFLPSIDRKTVIYVEGATKELELSIGDAQRVGYLGSEAAVAINLKTAKENIVLPQALDDIPGILKKDPTLGMDDVYTFIYTKQGLLDTSQKTRELLSGKGVQAFALPIDWKKDTIGNDSLDISLSPAFKIWTLQPIEVVIPLKAQIGPSEIEFFWEYNTYGAVHKERSVAIPFFADKQWHDYKFIIPAGGEYLKRVYFKSLLPAPEIGTAKIKGYTGD